MVGVSELQSVLWISMLDCKPSGHFVSERGGE